MVNPSGTVSNIWVAVISVIATALIPAIVVAMYRLWPMFQAMRAKGQVAVSSEWKELYEVQQRINEEMRRVGDEVKAELKGQRETNQQILALLRAQEIENAECRAWQARATEWILDVQDTLNAKGVYFRPWHPEPGDIIIRPKPALPSPPEAGK